jgi:patatin-like phospholipase/acyl hydrolase
VLSIDGGGIRGIIPAVILVELEARLRKRGKDAPLHRYFHLIGGTSTGGTIAAGLTAPHPERKNESAIDPAGLVDIYATQGADISSRDIFRRIREAVSDRLLGPD